MKKTVITAILCLAIGLGLGYFIFKNSNTPVPSTPTPSATPTKSAELTPSASPSETEIPTITSDLAVVKTACEAVELIKSQNFEKLSDMIHPEDGVYFAPYSYIDKNASMHFTSEQVKNFAADNTSYLWGITDGEGAPINLTPKQYFEKYVFAHDYTKAPVIGHDTIIKSGNSIENVKDVFPDCEFVEFHFPGFDEQFNGMDWSTLRIVFREYEGTYKIVAIINAQWTI